MNLPGFLLLLPDCVTELRHGRARQLSNRWKSTRSTDSFDIQLQKFRFLNLVNWPVSGMNDVPGRRELLLRVARRLQWRR